jgi:hypothetical protein
MNCKALLLEKVNCSVLLTPDNVVVGLIPGLGAQDLSNLTTLASFLR